MLDEVTQYISGYWNMGELEANATVFLNILGALLLGIFVGYERSYRGRAAGMRTYGLVCMASCALTVISGYPHLWFGGFSSILSLDPTRVIQGVVTGIGFLGAGVIMRDGLNISGLTTAASIWVVSAIGVMVGVGFYGGAIGMSLLSAAFMMWGSRIEGLLPARHAVAVILHLQKGVSISEDDIISLMRVKGYDIARGSFAINSRSGQIEWRFVVVSQGKSRGASLVQLGHELASTQGIENFNLAHARN
jgi:putative Mg2+ transporter-C (MgtC) family protein